MQAEPLTLDGHYENLQLQAPKMQPTNHYREHTIYSLEFGLSSQYVSSRDFRGDSEVQVKSGARCLAQIARQFGSQPDQFETAGVTQDEISRFDVENPYQSLGQSAESVGKFEQS